jgi:hypothetical protein
MYVKKCTLFNQPILMFIYQYLDVIEDTKDTVTCTSLDRYFYFYFHWSTDIEIIAHDNLNEKP